MKHRETGENDIFTFELILNRQTENYEHTIQLNI